MRPRPRAWHRDPAEAPRRAGRLDGRTARRSNGQDADDAGAEHGSTPCLAGPWPRAWHQETARRDRLGAARAAALRQCSQGQVDGLLGRSRPLDAVALDRPARVEDHYGPAQAPREPDLGESPPAPADDDHRFA